MVKDKKYLDAIVKGDFKIDIAYLKNLIEDRPENLPDNFCEKEIKIEILAQYFEKSAFKLLQSFIIKKQKYLVQSLKYTCYSCFKIIGPKDSSVSCDACLQWYHINKHCAEGFKKPTKNQTEEKDWICHTCKILPF